MSDNRREALEALRDKVEAGDIGDTGIDRFSAIPKRGGGVYADPNWYDAHAAYWRGSLDAAKALHESVLPERPCGITFGGEYGATVTLPPTWETMSVTWSNETPARAWLLSILSALISETPKGETL